MLPSYTCEFYSLCELKLCFFYYDPHKILLCFFPERVGAEVVECACVIELPELKVCLKLLYSCFMHKIV